MSIKKILIGLSFILMTSSIYADQKIKVSQIIDFNQGVINVINTTNIPKAVTSYTVTGPQSNLIVTALQYITGSMISNAGGLTNANAFDLKGSAAAVSNWVAGQNYLSVFVVSNLATTAFVSNTVSAATNNLWNYTVYLVAVTSNSLQSQITQNLNNSYPNSNPSNFVNRFQSIAIASATVYGLMPYIFASNAVYTANYINHILSTGTLNYAQSAYVLIGPQSNILANALQTSDFIIATNSLWISTTNLINDSTNSLWISTTNLVTGTSNVLMQSINIASTNYQGPLIQATNPIPGWITSATTGLATVSSVTIAATNLYATIVSGDVASTNTAYGYVVTYSNAVSNAISKANSAWQNPASAVYWTWTKTATEVTLTSYSGPDAVVIPDMLDGLPVTTISYVFSAPFEESTITSVSGGAFLTKIGITVFRRCVALTSVVFPTVKNIGDNAFDSCSGITSVYLPTVTNIGISAFNPCLALTNVVLPCIVTLGENSFDQCPNLVSVVFSGNALAEGTNMFGSYLNYGNSPNVTNYVNNPTATGWGTNWMGRPVVRLALYGDASNLTGINSGGITTNQLNSATNGLWIAVTNLNTITTNNLMTVSVPTIIGNSNAPIVAALSEFTNSVNALGTTQIVIKAALDGFTNSVNNIGTSLSGFTNQINAISSTQIVVKAALDGFTNSVNNIGTSLSGFTNSVNSLGSTQIVIKAALDGLTNSIINATNGIVNKAVTVVGLQSNTIASALQVESDTLQTVATRGATVAGGVAVGALTVPGYLEVAVDAGYILGHQNVVIGNTAHVAVTDAISLANFVSGAHLMAGLEDTGLYMLDYYDGAITNDWSIQSATGSHMLWIHCLQHPTWPVQFQNPVSIVGGASPVITSDNTVVCPNLNADLLDGYHIGDITPSLIGAATPNTVSTMIQASNVVERANMASVIQASNVVERANVAIIIQGSNVVERANTISVAASTAGATGAVVQAAAATDTTNIVAGIMTTGTVANATYAGTVTGVQSGLVATAVQPTDTHYLAAITNLQSGVTLSNLLTTATTKNWETHIRQRAVTGLVSFVFDDTFSSQYTNAKPVFDSLGVVGSLAIVSDFVGSDTSYLSWAQLTNFQAAGWEIMSHSKTHTVRLYVTNEATIRAEMDLAPFVQRGFVVNNFVWPWGDSGPVSRRIAFDYYRSCRGIEEAQNTSPLRTYDLYSYAIDNTALSNSYKAAILTAKANNSWVTFYSHETTAAVSNMLAQLITYAQANGVSIVTVNQGLDRVGNMLDVGESLAVGASGTTKMSGNVCINGGDYISTAGALRLMDNANVVFRGLRSGAWPDSVNSQFFQIGNDSDYVLLTAASGSPMTRTYASSAAFQISSAYYNATILPTYLFQVDNGTTPFFGVSAVGTTIARTNAVVCGSLSVSNGLTVVGTVTGITAEQIGATSTNTVATIIQGSNVVERGNAAGLYATIVTNTQPAQAFTGYVVSDAGGTCTVVYASGPLVQIIASTNTTIHFGTTGYPTTGGVLRVGIELWSGTNAISFNTSSITNPTAMTLNTNAWNSLFFRRNASSTLWTGRQ